MVPFAYHFCHSGTPMLPWKRPLLHSSNAPTRIILSYRWRPTTTLLYCTNKFLMTGPIPAIQHSFNPFSFVVSEGGVSINGYMCFVFCVALYHIAFLPAISRRRRFLFLSPRGPLWKKIMDLLINSDAREIKGVQLPKLELDTIGVFGLNTSKSTDKEILRWEGNQLWDRCLNTCKMANLRVSKIKRKWGLWMK